jgi:D-sedoheptulose 7-phosphate isomerase
MIKLSDYAKAFATVQFDGTIDDAVELARYTIHKGRGIFFVGNGGSAAIASHMAADWTKTAKCRAMCFNDPCFLTMFGNDHGFDSVFTSPLLLYGSAGDLLFAISSSGRSHNIVGAANTARGSSFGVITLSGFNPENPLRKVGDLNFFVPSSEYGIVEVAHLAICHVILDRVAAL